MKNHIDLKKAKFISTSNNDLIKLLGRYIKIIKYSDLKHITNIDELLQPPNYECILLYETSDNNGHWTCIYRYGNKINFFDSFGLKPDDEFHKITIDYRKESGVVYPCLTYLLSDVNDPIEFNNYKLQDYAYSTCGYWCVARLLLKSLSMYQFYKLFKSDTLNKPDDLVILSLF